MEEMAFFFYRVGSGNQTQIIRVCSKFLYLLIISLAPGFCLWRNAMSQLSSVLMGAEIFHFAGY